MTDGERMETRSSQNKRLGFRSIPIDHPRVTTGGIRLGIDLIRFSHQIITARIALAEGRRALGNAHRNRVVLIPCDFKIEGQLGKLEKAGRTVG